MRLSVVVTIVDAGAALERCLAGLATQERAPNLQIIVPWDDSVPDIPYLAARFPEVAFPAMGTVLTDRPSTGAAGQHELFDRRRSVGLALADGDVVAILEDRGVPRPDWARNLVRLHEQLPHAVIGGAIENGRDSLLSWAVFFCDFGRYMRPFSAGPRDWVSDINIAYKRRALESTRYLWQERYHETTVHWALRRNGETLFLSPEFAVDQMRDDLSLGRLLVERVAWGRLFAYTRARESVLPRRIALAILAPVLPVLLWARQARLRARSRSRAALFLRVSPAVILLLTAWSLGEAVGYLTARP